MANEESLSPRQATRLSDIGELDRRRLIVAYLKAQGLSHDQICALLSRLPEAIAVKPPVIVNDLARAALDKWIVTRFKSELFKKPLVRELDELVHRQPWLSLERQLQELSHGVFKRLYVIHSDGDRDPEQKDWRRILDRFAQNAAPSVAELLAPASIVGVCWGETVRCLIDALLELNLEIDLSRQKRVIVVPTAGQPQGLAFRTSGWDSSTLARSLSRFLNGSDAHVPSLDNVRPVVQIQERFADSKEVLEAVREAILDDSSHKDIFGSGLQDRRALLNRADAILASFGAFHNPKTMLWEWMGAHGIDVKAVAMGDIGGALIPRRDVSIEKFNGVARMWTGIRLEHFEAVAQRTPGVIVYGAGFHKGAIALELVRRRLVTTLIADEQLVHGLETALKGS
jgi:DNA-binding transcriptional regulator LsrR (DeoR family)